MIIKDDIPAMVTINPRTGHVDWRDKAWKVILKEGDWCKGELAMRVKMGENDIEPYLTGTIPSDPVAIQYSMIGAIERVYGSPFGGGMASLIVSKLMSETETQSLQELQDWQDLSYTTHAAVIELLKYVEGE